MVFTLIISNRFLYYIKLLWLKFRLHCLLLAETSSKAYLQLNIILDIASGNANYNSNLNSISVIYFGFNANWIKF